VSARRLPDGTTTTDADAYLSAWDNLAAPLCKRLEWTYVAFDPGCVFEVEPGVTVSLPVSVVRYLTYAFAERDELARLLTLSEAAIEDANRAVGRAWLRPGVSLAKAIKAKCDALEALNGGAS